MPFGLYGAPATFQRLMQRCVGGDLTYSMLFVYLDDICIYSRTFEDHLKHLDLVFILQGDSLSWSCFIRELKMRSEWPVPRTCSVKNRRSFLGFASYYIDDLFPILHS